MVASSHRTLVGDLTAGDLGVEKRSSLSKPSLCMALMVSTIPLRYLCVLLSFHAVTVANPDGYYWNERNRPNGGGMKGLAFALDPDGYRVEIVKRGLRPRNGGELRRVERRDVEVRAQLA